MALSSPQSPGDTAMAQSSVPSVSGPAALADFWSHFRLFPLNFEDYSFDHWYLFPIGYYIILALLAVILDLRLRPYYLLHDFSQTYTRFTLFNRIHIVEIIGTSLIALTFNNWRHNIAGTFQTLLSKERIRSSHQGVDISSIQLEPLFWSVKLIYDLIDTALAFLLEAYFIGVGSWVIIVTGTYIKRLAIQFDLHIIPGHPDNCGGLKVLGNFCLGMALPVLVLAMLLGTLGIGDLVAKSYPIALITNLALFLFVLPLAAFTFFVPLWNIHGKMLEEREEYEDKFAERNTQLQQRIQSSLDKQDVADATAAREEMEILQVLHPDKIGFPVWPYDRSILLKFLTPQIIPLLSLLSGLVGPLVAVLRSLFS
jgi:hypothetical protein